MVPMNSGAPHRRSEAGDHPEVLLGRLQALMVVAIGMAQQRPLRVATVAVLVDRMADISMRLCEAMEGDQAAMVEAFDRQIETLRLRVASRGTVH